MSATTAGGAFRFREIYEREPEGAWGAPGRVNLIGEHTDYNEGFVMPLALPHLCRVEAARRDDGVLRVHSSDQPGGVVELTLDGLAPVAEGFAGGWAAYPAGVAWSLRAAGYRVGGADLHFESTVPTGAGLSSSAALEVSTGLALDDLYGLGLDRPRLAEVCRRAENEFVGVPSGILDQMAAACCTEGHALHLDTRDLQRRQVPFDLALEGLRLLVVDTRVKHELGDGAYAERRRGCEAGAAALGVRALRDVPLDGLDEALGRIEDPVVRRYVHHVVTEDDRVRQVIELLDAGETRAVGPVLTAGHRSLRDDFAVSCSELDLVVEVAVDRGALGARMTGGGFGGSAIVLLDEGLVDDVREALVLAFAEAGYAEPEVFEAVPSAGARRLTA
ncbi:galactokinase [Streptomyces xiaopingdaonensis]|uniref:galactokinase n=1 Tax=Streptomyces xiaopingdaonensis TaxID=1565415 RepID=UPI000301DE54|nr:galactokinase [Streptomyces xiaopingdaonensis]